MVPSPHSASAALTVTVVDRSPAGAEATAARYRAEISRWRRWTRMVLIVGTVASLACAFGPLWMVRLGLLTALGAALCSCLLAWREIGLERRAHAAAMLAASKRHGAQLTEERRHNAAVVDSMSRRAQAADARARSRAATIARLNGELDRLQGDVNGLRGANGRLTRDLNFRDVTIRELRETLTRHEAELLSARGAGQVEEQVGEVHAFPRRPLRDDAEIDYLGGRDVEFLVGQASITMPNYEEDRRFA